jgi:hypothetical protein
LIGHRLRGIGAGYPKHFDFPVSRRLKHFHGSFARHGGHFF